MTHAQVKNNIILEVMSTTPLLSKTIRMRFVEETDAEFILKLRLDVKYNKYLSSVSKSLEAQTVWIKNYKQDEVIKKQFYFIIERNDGVPCGTVRIYDLRKDSFSWGSWILNEDKSHYAALESAFLVYQFGFDYLGYSKSHFEVRKGNKKVISFHQKMGAIQTGESKEDYFFEISKQAVKSIQHKLKEKICQSHS